MGIEYLFMVVWKTAAGRQGCPMGTQIALKLVALKILKSLLGDRWISLATACAQSFGIHLLHFNANNGKIDASHKQKAQ